MYSCIPVVCLSTCWFLVYQLCSCLPVVFLSTCWVLVYLLGACLPVQGPSAAPFCARCLMQGCVNFAAASQRFLVGGRSLAGHGPAVASQMASVPKSAAFRKIGLAPRPANFRNLVANVAGQFLGQFSGPIFRQARKRPIFRQPPGPIFSQADFSANSPGQFLTRPIFRPTPRSNFFLLESGQFL